MTTVTIPVPRNELPGLGQLLDGSLWRRWADQGRVFPLGRFHAAVRYVRFKPQTSCRVVVFRPETGNGSDDAPRAFLLHLYAGRDRAAEAFRKIEGRRSGKQADAFPPFLDAAGAVIAAPFPLDPELPALRDFCRPYRRKEALADLLVDYHRDSWRISKSRMRLRLLTYKPGRRAVFRAALRMNRLDGTKDAILSLHLQIEHADTLGRSYRNSCRVHEALPAAATWSVPAPLGMIEDRCLLASSWELGSPLTEFIGGAFNSATLRTTACALAGLHGLDIAPEQTGTAQRPDDLRLLARDLADLLPEDESRILNLGERLTALAASLERCGTTVFAHGDFHPGQVLVQYGRVVLVDFDRARHDHAATDIGSFVARLIEMGRERRSIDFFVRSYRETAKRDVRDTDIDAAVAIALFRRASVPFRELAPNWPDRIRDRLRSVEAALPVAR
jgi:hypothetical protein